MKPLCWTFPLPRTHTGVPLANGRIGALVWGDGAVLRITLGLTDLWDHRGGMPWTDQQSFAAIRECLESPDEQRLRELFEGVEPPDDTPRRPSVIPLGRLDLQFPHGCTLVGAELSADTGVVVVSVTCGEGTHTVAVRVDPRRDLLSVGLHGCPAPRVTAVPSWELAGDTLRGIGFSEPVAYGDDTGGGWVQPFPADPAVAVGWRVADAVLLAAAGRGETDDDARQTVDVFLARASRDGMQVLATRCGDWWSAFHEKIPTVRIPNATLQLLYDYGMYKFGAVSNPRGVASGLQGPWIEEYALPPWSADYHFNINVQMCYWPAYRGNCLEHLRPLWDLLDSWHEPMAHNARVFVGIDDGYMLPHAVDDRCVPMGGFWSGAIDHGCTAWVARMMYRWYEYTQDIEFLRRNAFPFMVRTMRVYEEMLERLDDGGYRLPVSVSPEYGGNRFDAWGANASFQLAAIHRLVSDLLSAAEKLGEPARPVWHEVARGLPKATLCQWQGPRTAAFEYHPDPYEVIALWEGQPLEESHRHHSHLAGIFPFDTIDPCDPAWRTIVEDTYKQWVYHGMGLWSGWCIPWAAILHARIGNGSMAEHLLETYARFFTNEGHNSVHDARYAGLSLLGAPMPGPGPTRAARERMQIDACMAAVTAVQEMLLCTRQGVNYVLSGVPESWKDVSFDGMRTAGAFLIGATRADGVVGEVRVRSLAGGELRLGNPFGGPVGVERMDGCDVVEGDVLVLAVERGSEVRCRAARGRT